MAHAIIMCWAEFIPRVGMFRNEPFERRVDEVAGPMKYYKTSQPVPGKGEAWMFYECSDEARILRYVTVIPATGEIERNSNPVVKKLYRPDLLTESSAQEFSDALARHWLQE